MIYFNQRVVFTKIDLTNFVRGDLAFASNRRHQVTSLDPVASSNCHEQPRGSTGTSFRAVLGTLARSGKDVGSGSSPLCALPLENMEGSSGELGAVELVEERLE